MLTSLIGFELSTGTWLFGNVEPPNITKREITYDRSSLNPEYGKYKFSTEENFTRIISSKKKDIKNSSCNILLLGGSTTEQKILRLNETWGYLLREDLNKNTELQKRCPEGINVINAGISGHSIYSNIYDLKYWLNKSINKVDLVILYQGINDNRLGFNINQFNIKQKIKYNLERKFSDQYYGYIYHSSIYKIYNNIKKRIYNNHISNFLKDGILKVNITEGLKEDLENNIIKIKNSDLVEIYDGSISNNYRKNILKFIKSVEEIYDAKLLVITQTFPICDLSQKNYIKYISNKNYPNLKKIRDSNFEYINITAEEYHNTSFGRCLRAKINKDNYLKVYNDLSNYRKQNIQILDYAGLSKIDLDFIEYDLYHTSPRTSKILYLNFKRYKILEKIKDLLLR